MTSLNLNRTEGINMYSWHLPEIEKFAARIYFYYFPRNFLLVY